MTSTKYYYKIFDRIGPDISLIKSRLLGKKKRIGSAFEPTLHISKYPLCPVWFQNVMCIKSKLLPTYRSTWLRNIVSHFLNLSTHGKMTRVGVNPFNMLSKPGL